MATPITPIDITGIYEPGPIQVLIGSGAELSRKLTVRSPRWPWASWLYRFDEHLRLPDWCYEYQTVICRVTGYDVRLDEDGNQVCSVSLAIPNRKYHDI